LLTLQTLPAALIVAARTGHRDLLADIKREKQEKLSESFAKVSEKSSVGNEGIPKVGDWRKLRPTLSDEDVYNMAYLSPADVGKVAEKFDVTTRTVENWRSYARSELGVD